MAITPVTPFYRPTLFSFGTAGGGTFVNSALNDGTDRVAFTFPAPKTGTLRYVEWRQGTNATSPTNGIRLSFQDLDASGDPDGTEDFWRDITSGFGAGAWLVPPGPMTDDGTNGGNKKVISNVGERITVVASLPSFVAGSVTMSTFDMPGATTNPTLNYRYYCDVFAAAWSKNLNTGIIALLYDDGNYYEIPGWVFPVLAFNTATFNSGSTPDERGLIFRPDVDLEVSGAFARIDLDNAADFVLYDTDGSTVLASVSMSSAERTSTAGLTADVYFPPVTLTNGQDYRLVIKPGASDVSLYDFDVNSAALMAAVPCGATWHYTERTDAGAWTETTTKRPWMGLYITGMDTNISGGGEHAYAF